MELLGDLQADMIQAGLLLRKEHMLIEAAKVPIIKGPVHCGQSVAD